MNSSKVLTEHQASEGQVQLFKLIFTVNWEDPGSDELALRFRKGDAVMTITSGGCNTLSFLLHDPEVIYAIDINRCQAFLLELKIAAIRELEHGVCLKFFGLLPAKNRLELYKALSRHLSPEARNYWNGQEKILKEGFLLGGRYEKFVRLVGRFIKLIMGKKRIEGLFRTGSLEEQQAFYEKYWNNRRTRMIFKLFFNKVMLARKGLEADYFQFDDGSGSYAESFFLRFQKVLRDLPLSGNYYVHLYLKSIYRNTSEVPLYLQKEHYPLIRERLNRIRIYTADAKQWLADQEANMIDCFSLSNICELMDAKDTQYTFEQVHRTARPGARVCFRNLMVPREVPEDLQDKIRKEADTSKLMMEQDRSFVYGKNAAYTIQK